MFPQTSNKLTGLSLSYMLASLTTSPCSLFPTYTPPQVWPEGALTQLQDCVDNTCWDVFGQGRPHGSEEPLEDVARPTTYYTQTLTTAGLL